MDGVSNYYSTEANQNTESTQWLSASTATLFTGLTLVCTYLFHRYVVRPFELYDAVKFGTESEVINLLDEGIRVDGHRYSMWIGSSPLQMACDYNRTAIAKQLIARGATVNGRYYTITIEEGNNRFLKKVILNELTPLHTASKKNNRELTSFLIQYGAEIDAKVHLNQTPLHYACNSNAKDTVALLLQNGADVNAKDQLGTTPLQIACASQRCDEALIKLLLDNGANINAGSEAKFTPLSLACNQNNIEVVKLLIQRGAKLEPWILHHLCQDNAKKDIVEILLKEKIDINALDRYLDETPLHMACKKNAHEIAELLLQHQADREAKNFAKQTPLHVACESNAVETVKVLLKHQANIHAQDNLDDSPLFTAYRHNAKEVLEILLQNKVDVNSRRDIRQETLLHLACRDNNEEIIKLLLHHGADVNVKEDMKETPLHFACRNNNITAVKLLQENGADFNAENEVRQTPLHVACKHKPSKELTLFLIQNEAEVNKKTIIKETPLHQACQSNAKEAVEVLLQNGAQVNALDLHKHTPLDIAYLFNACPEIVQLLKQHSAPTSTNYRIQMSYKIKIFCERVRQYFPFKIEYERHD